MPELTKDEIDTIREAIDSYRAALRENYIASHSGPVVLPATMTEEDTSEAWRAYEAGKRIDKAEWKLIRLLEAYVGIIDSVRYQGIRYSIRKGQRWNDQISSYYELVERADSMLDLDWPEGARKPDLPSPPQTW